MVKSLQCIFMALLLVPISNATFAATCPPEAFKWGDKVGFAKPSKELVEQTLASGLDADCFDSDQRTLLMHIAFAIQDAGDNNRIAETIAYVLEHGGNPKKKNAAGKTAADIAQERKKPAKYSQLQAAIDLMNKMGVANYADATKQKERMTKKEKEQFLKNVAAFRKNLKLGDDTSYGMVIEIKRPLAKIQTTEYIVSHYTEWKTKYNSYGSYKDPEVSTQSNSVSVEKWFRIDDLYPNN